MCISVFGKTEKELYKNISKAAKESHLIEVRLDYLVNPSITTLEYISSHFSSIKFIITCRMKEFGGHFQDDVELWSELMERSIELSFNYIDIDFGLIQDINPIENLKKIKLDSSSTTQLIFSYHNFTQTPDYLDLELISNQMAVSGADIQKFATTVSFQEDLKKLAIHLSYKVSSDKYVVVGMGDNQFARQSRIITLLLGSEWGFFCLKDNTTAPGQIDIQTAKQLFELLI